MKKILCSIFVFIMIFALVGCANSGEAKLARRLSVNTNNLLQAINNLESLTNEDVAISDFLGDNNSINNISYSFNNQSINNYPIKKVSKTKQLFGGAFINDFRNVNTYSERQIMPINSYNPRNYKNNDIVNYKAKYTSTDGNTNNNFIELYKNRMESLYNACGDCLYANNQCNSCKNDLKTSIEECKTLCNKLNTGEIVLSESQLQECNNYCDEINDLCSKIKGCKGDCNSYLSTLKNSKSYFGSNTESLTTNYLNLLDCLECRLGYYNQALDCVNKCNNLLKSCYTPKNGNNSNDNLSNNLNNNVNYNNSNNTNFNNLNNTYNGTQTNKTQPEVNGTRPITQPIVNGNRPTQPIINRPVTQPIVGGNRPVNNNLNGVRPFNGNNVVNNSNKNGISTNTINNKVTTNCDNCNNCVNCDYCKNNNCYNCVGNTCVDGNCINGNCINGNCINGNCINGNCVGNNCNNVVNGSNLGYNYNGINPYNQTPNNVNTYGPIYRNIDTYNNIVRNTDTFNNQNSINQPIVFDTNRNIANNVRIDNNENQNDEIKNNENEERDYLQTRKIIKRPKYIRERDTRNLNYNAVEDERENKNLNNYSAFDNNKANDVVLNKNENILDKKVLNKNEVVLNNENKDTLNKNVANEVDKNIIKPYVEHSTNTNPLTKDIKTDENLKHKNSTENSVKTEETKNIQLLNNKKDDKEKETLENKTTKEIKPEVKLLNDKKMNENNKKVETNKNDVEKKINNNNENVNEIKIDKKENEIKDGEKHEAMPISIEETKPTFLSTNA